MSNRGKLVAVFREAREQSFTFVYVTPPVNTLPLTFQDSIRVCDPGLDVSMVESRETSSCYYYLLLLPATPVSLTTLTQALSRFFTGDDTTEIGSLPFSWEITMSSTGIAVGVNRGYPVEKREKKPRPSNQKGRLCKKTKLVRELIGEVGLF